MVRTSVKPGEVVLGDQKKWKAVSHPLRHALLRVLGKREMTNEELAKELGVASGKLYFHTKKLLDAGLIEPAGTRQKGHLTEKLYRKVGTGFFIPTNEDGSAPPLYHFIENSLRLYAEAWENAEGNKLPQRGYHVMKYLPRDSMLEVDRRLLEILDYIDQETVDPETDGAQLYSVSALLFRMLPEGKAET